MKKTLFLAIIPIVLLSSCSMNTNENTTSSNTNTTNTTINVTKPERKMDIYGKVVSQEGNEITLLQVDTSKDPTFNMDSEEKKEYMQSMDEASKKAFKEEIKNSTLGQIKMIIPVGIAMTKKEAQGPDAPIVEASLADIQVGGYISVWLNQDIKDQKIAEFVKVSFVQ